MWKEHSGRGQQGPQGDKKQVSGCGRNDGEGEGGQVRGEARPLPSQQSVPKTRRVGGPGPTPGPRCPHTTGAGGNRPLLPSDLSGDKRGNP